MTRTRLIVIVFVTFVKIVFGQPCVDNDNQPRNVGSFWKAGPTTICECTQGAKVVCHNNLGHCTGVTDVHYTSFDRKYFDFHGICRYNLVRDCEKGSFSIAVQQEPWSHNKKTAISEAFNITFGIYHLRLYKPEPIVEVVKNGGPANFTGHIYVDPEVRCEMIGKYMMVSLIKHKIWFRWEFNWLFEVWVDKKHKGKLCGICGDWDGDKDNDLTLTPNNNPVNPNLSEWGIAWRTFDQPDRCAKSVEAEYDGKLGRPITPLQAAVNVKTCDNVFKDAFMNDCKKKVDPAPYIESCKLELEACQEKQLDGCMAFALDPYILACEDNEVVVPETWKIGFKVQDCEVKASNGTVKYQHLSQWSEGCKLYTCKNGKIETKTTCIECKWPGKLSLIPHGQRKFYGCYFYMCNKGKWTSTGGVDKKYCCWDKEKFKYSLCAAYKKDAAP